MNDLMLVLNKKILIFTNVSKFLHLSPSITELVDEVNHVIGLLIRNVKSSAKTKQTFVLFWPFEFCIRSFFFFDLKQKSNL